MTSHWLNLDWNAHRKIHSLIWSNSNYRQSLNRGTKKSSKYDQFRVIKWLKWSSICINVTITNGLQACRPIHSNNANAMISLNSCYSNESEASKMIILILVALLCQFMMIQMDCFRIISLTYNTETSMILPMLK
jgi:hypothetical protein